MKDYSCVIVKKIEICHNVFLLSLETRPYDRALKIVSGQFAMVKIPNRADMSLRRPFCITNFDYNAGTFDIVFRIVGEGTEALASSECGQCLQVLLPLGNGWNIDSSKKNIWLIGGGMGTIALASLQKSFPNYNYTVCLGFKNAQESKLATLFDNPIVCTDDGSVGFNGLVVDIVHNMLNDKSGAHSKPDLVLACGPLPLLKRLKTMHSLADTQIFVSLENRMACGVGACMTCVVDCGQDKLSVCKDGPVFDIRKIDL